jgi:[glutamine synthetase] adenylyltransferase / [glutamine synthetase]-adenylyl-L-tyrosine phosphorylase
VPLDVSVVADIWFQNPESAKLRLERVAQRLSPVLRGVLPTLLAESPDPDSALIQFDRLLSEASPEVSHLLDQHPQLAHYAVLVFGHSRFLGETLLQNPDVLHSLLRPKILDQNLSREDLREGLARFRARTLEKDTAQTLARFKRREYVRILVRDVLRIASLGEVTAEISALADVLLEEALREANRSLLARYDPPQHLDENERAVETPFTILSLGKLGGNELNYSSDIDLMYIFGDGAEVPKAAISNREYFIRLAQQVTELLSRVTSEGPVFRIDLRLRPQGREGELAINLGQALHYYANIAHDWERQALIKVRYSAGDAGLAWQFIQGVQSYVYSEGMAEIEAGSDREAAQVGRRQGLNFAAIKTALMAREKIHNRSAGLANKPPGIDVKLESGGIRDIEFLVQCLQRVYGANEPWLRSGGTLASLHKLHDKQHLSGQEFQQLTSAYEFLRHLEHRLQGREGRQTHRLPASGGELHIIARSMESWLGPEQRLQGHDFVTAVRQRMAAVAEIYQRIVYQQQEWEHGEGAASEFQLRAHAEPSAAERSSQQVLERLARDAPALYEVASGGGLSPTARKNLLRFLTSAFTSSERYAEVLRHAGSVTVALQLFESSEYLTDILVRHPDEIASVAGIDEGRARAGSGYLFDSALGGGRAAADPVFAYLAGSSAPRVEKVALLRRHFRHRAFAAGTKDVIKHRSVYESFAEMTSAADDAIAAAWEIAGAREGLAVLALGRLGSGEFDVLSDADIIFVIEEDRDREALTRVASQMVQVLSAYTQEGMVFSTDTRLRPRGRDGELLVTPAHLADYFLQEAQAWEALVYTKLRFVAGSRRLGERAEAVCRNLFERFATDARFACGVREMRGKLETAEVLAQNLKTSEGAIYDIDFLCGFLLVKHQIAPTGGTLRDRLWRCASAGLLQNSEARVLDHAGELLRTVEHVVRLVTGRTAKWLPSNEHARAAVENLASRMLGREFPDGLEEELKHSCGEVRAVFDRVVA